MSAHLPWQIYDDLSTPATCVERLTLLRAELAERGLDGFIMPRADEHQGEAVPAASERLAWLTSFTGSVGMAVVLAEKAAVFVDGRYTLQIREQTDTGVFEPRDAIGEGPEAWIEGHARGARLGYDPWLFPPNHLARLKAAAAKAGAELVACQGNPIDAVWHDRPPMPCSEAIAHPLALSGEEAADKRARIGAALRKDGIDTAVLSLPDSICWLFNIRGRDVPHTPFVLAFALVHADASADLFIAPEKLSDRLIAHLGPAVRLHPPGDFLAMLSTLKDKRVLLDPASAPSAALDALEAAGALVVRKPDPCQLPKACKNPVEIEGLRKAHIRDGAAMANFLCWLSAAALKGDLTEISAAERLEQFRRDAGAVDLSFDAISAAGAHAAQPHYHPMRASNAPLVDGRVYLIDSGGQYPDGTTDITRTVMIGTPTDEIRDRFTRVLKGHIALATARFPEGTLGLALDSFARRPLWQEGLDYNHGTGHGIGSFLSVHEGPQNISKRLIDQPLIEGMVVSNEPGYYKPGEYGIRIENLIVVRRCQGAHERPMLEFETVSLCPIDRAMIDANLLTTDERGWLDAYHARVRESLIDFVAEQTRNWLIAATEPLSW